VANGKLVNEFSPGALEGETVAEFKTMIDRSHALPVTGQRGN